MLKLRSLTFFLGVLLLLCNACAAPRSSHQQSEFAASLSTPDLVREAGLAYIQGRYSTSELYYSRLAKRQDLEPQAMPLIYKRLTASAVALEHYNNAFVAFSKWQQSDPMVDESPVFFDLGITLYHQLGMRSELAKLLNKLLKDKSLNWEVREKSGNTLASVLFEEGEFAEALKILNAFYSLAEKKDEQLVMEHAFLRRLRDEPWNPSFVELLTEQNRSMFPYAIIAFENARRLALTDEDAWASAWKLMQQVVLDSELVDKSYMTDVLKALEKENGHPTVGIVVALPLTGKYGTVGRKIADGISAAQWMLANKGLELEIKIVNTDAPQWCERIASLPPYFMFGGGPLRVDSFKALETSNAWNGKAFFTFLPELAEGVEGRYAWRFFPSRRDEVRTLAQLATEALGINRLAILAPDEPYGTSMGKLFRQEAVALGATVENMQSYPPDDHPRWGPAVAQLLQIPPEFDKEEEPLPAAEFGAVFLPDGWSQAQLIIPHFFFYEQADMIFLGPDLWSRALDEQGTQESYFNLTVCPGAWRADSAGAHALQEFLDQDGLGLADFWVALGYDYIQLIAKMKDLPSDWTVADVNSRLSVSQQMQFALAPMFWDEAGQASQQLYLFSPSKNGRVLTDITMLERGIARAQAKRTQRMELWEEKQKEKAEQEQEDELIQSQEIN